MRHSHDEGVHGIDSPFESGIFTERCYHMSGQNVIRIAKYDRQAPLKKAYTWRLKRDKKGMTGGMLKSA